LEQKETGGQLDRVFKLSGIAEKEQRGRPGAVDRVVHEVHVWNRRRSTARLTGQKVEKIEFDRSTREDCTDYTGQLG